MRKRSSSSHPKRRSYFLALGGVVLGFVITLSASGSAPFMSAEVKFADASLSGLSIMPASCPSSPHWQDECSMPTSCVISVTPNRYTAGTVSSVQLHWEAPQPPASYDSQIASINGTVTSIGGVFPSGTLDVAAPAFSMTYTYNGAYLDSSGATLGTFSCSAPLTVSASQPLSLYISQVELYRNANDPVYPGDRITYRMYVSNTGNQTWVSISDHIPANTTLIWQGGGTTCSAARCDSAGTPNGNGDIWWTQQQAPSGWSGYVDFTVQVNAGAPNGTQICNTAYANSRQVSVVSSNQICNPIAVVCPLYLDPAVANSLGYKARAYQASGERADRNTPPICVTNTSGSNYFIPANTSAEIESFKSAVDANTVPGADYTPIQ